MFSGAEDDDLFNPASSSHLASLFGTSMTFKQNPDASLIYTAPKQPKPGGQETPKTSPKPVPQSSVICSKFVDVFKLLDKQHASQGKCGLAIIGSDALKAYEVIIYKSKQDIIMRTKLKSDFIFTIQSNNFAHFCDDQKQHWSVHFENSKEVDSFIHEIETRGGKVMCNNKNSDVSSVPQNEMPQIRPKAEDSGNISSPTVAKDTDSDTSSSQTKANILSRMAKMGQSILPANLPKTSSDHSDSETDEQEVNRKSIKKRPKHVTVKGEHTTGEKENATSNNKSLNTQPSIPEFVMINGQLLPVSVVQQNLPLTFPNTVHNQLIPNIPNQLIMNQPQVSPMTDSLHVFIAENRTHNCEMRMNVTQLSSKLDTVLERLNKSDSVSSYDTNELNELKLKLAKELEKNKVLTNTKHAEEQQSELDKKIIDDLKQQTESQKKIINDQEENIQELKRYKIVLEQQDVHSNTLQQQLEEYQQTVSNLQQTIDHQKAELESLTKFCEENKNLSITNDELNNSIASLKSQLGDKNSKADLFAKKLKQSMNLLYQQIMENFEDESITFQSAQIKQIVSQKLKNATFTIIQEFQNDFKDRGVNPQIENNESNSSVPQL